MSRYAMDPVHLRKDELEYELLIRGLPAQVTRQRLKSIYDHLALEKEGACQMPDARVAGDNISNYVRCREGVVGLEEALKAAAESYDELTKNGIFSRLSHYHSRLERLNNDDDASFVSEVNALKERVGDEVTFPNLVMLKVLNSEDLEEGALTFLEGTSKHSIIEKDKNSFDVLTALRIDKPTGTIPKEPSKPNNGKKSNKSKDKQSGLIPSHFQTGSLEDFSVYGNEDLSSGLVENVNITEAITKGNKPVWGSVPPFPTGNKALRVVNSRNFNDRRLVNSQCFNNSSNKGKERGMSPLRNDFERLSVNRGNVLSSSPTPQSKIVNENVRSNVADKNYRNPNYGGDQRVRIQEPRLSQETYSSGFNNRYGPNRVYEPERNYHIPLNDNAYRTERNIATRPQEIQRPNYREFSNPPAYEDNIYQNEVPHRHNNYVPRVGERAPELIVAPRGYRNPITHWNLVFTGDNRGFNVNSFLTQITHMARADRVTGPDLLASAIHLFSGPARNWYMAFADSFVTWEDLTHSLRRQFIPYDGDYHILKEIESRCQGRDEPFILYLSSMINLFNHLEEPFTEARKVKVVMRNMSLYLSDRLALYDIRTTDELSQYCKRIEDAKNKHKDNYKIPSVYEPSNILKSVAPPLINRRQIFDVETPVQRSFKNPANSLYEPNKNQRNRAVSPQRQVAFKDLVDDEGDFCWNCRKRGHLFENCNLAKMRVFCYLCGELGQFANSCIYCHPSGNGTDCLYRKSSGRDSPNP